MPPSPPPAHILNAAPGLWSEAGQGHWVPVQGPSMQPFLQPGDDVWISPISDQLRRGEVVVLTTPTGLLVHRLLRAEPWSKPRRVWTQGDNNRLPDKAFNAAGLLGRVVAVRRRDGELSLDTPRWRATGWLIASGFMALNNLAWGAPGRLAAGAGWRLQRLFCSIACR